jgi:hypothetical protein
MAIRYKDPKSVLSPRDAVRKVDVIYDEGEEGVSVAKVQWYDKEVVGIRWNVALREWDNNEKMAGIKECMGLPTSRGYATWFILPEALLDNQSEISKTVRAIKLKKD